MKHKKSLTEEVQGTVDTEHQKSWLKRLFAFLGPAYLVGVGYVDPGNWATDIAGGSQFGYKLLWVLLMSNMIAIVLQSLCTRLGIVRNRDLAQASREAFHPIANFALYILAEIAMVATDLAEVIGMAIGLNLLFGIPMIWGVCITALDSILLLFLINKGIRRMEAFIVGLVAIIALSFLVEMFLAKPEVSGIVSGLVPSIPNKDALYIAIGIIGATVMPHNLYLHSSLVQSRKINRSKKGIKEALRFNLIDSTIALNLAFFVNAAILILAASVFHSKGFNQVAEIQDAYVLLEPLLGNQLAPILFAVALIAAGQSSTLTGTLAGQIVMEGYLHLRINPVARRLITRLLAIVPALVSIIYFGPDSSGDLLVLSQVVLSLQLAFAMIPLIHFVSEKRKMGGFHIKLPIKVIAWAITVVIVALNIQLVVNELESWMQEANNPIYLWILVVPIITGLLILLVYVFIKPLINESEENHRILVPHITEAQVKELSTSFSYQNIAIAVDFSISDKESIATALQLGKKEATYTLIHIVETAGAIFYGREVEDYESGSDKKFLEAYQNELQSRGYQIVVKLGFGSPKKVIPEIVNQGNFDLLVLGTHGHSGIKDFIFGATVDSVRHRVDVPVFIVKQPLPFSK